jgi:hypothetical protein
MKSHARWLIPAAGVILFILCLGGALLATFLRGEFSRYPAAGRTCPSSVSIEGSFLFFQSCFSTSDGINQIYDWYADRGWNLAMAEDESVLYGYFETAFGGFYLLQHIEVSPDQSTKQLDLTVTIRFRMVPTWWPVGVPGPLRTNP